MAETARRTGHAHGSDVVRRLIARPIRMQSTQAFRQAAVTAPRQPAVSARAVEAVPEPPQAPHDAQAVDAGRARPEPRPESQPEPPAAPNANADRLRTEMMLMKAVLQAERRENANLRACLGFDEADATESPEARAVRDRWAALVDRLLHAPA